MLTLILCLPRLSFILWIYYSSSCFYFYRLCYYRIMEKLRRWGEVLHIDSPSFSLPSPLSFRPKMVENLCLRDFSRSFRIYFYSGLNSVSSGSR